MSKICCLKGSLTFHLSILKVFKLVASASVSYMQIKNDTLSFLLVWKIVKLLPKIFIHRGIIFQFW